MPYHRIDPSDVGSELRTHNAELRTAVSNYREPLMTNNQPMHDIEELRTRLLEARRFL
jgi:hypothetical protein